MFLCLLFVSLDESNLIVSEFSSVVYVCSCFFLVARDAQFDHPTMLGVREKGWIYSNLAEAIK